MSFLCCARSLIASATNFSCRLHSTNTDSSESMERSSLLSSEKLPARRQFNLRRRFSSLDRVIFFCSCRTSASKVLWVSLALSHFFSSVSRAIRRYALACSSIAVEVILVVVFALLERGSSRLMISMDESDDAFRDRDLFR